MTTFANKKNPFTLDADGDYELGGVGTNAVGIVTIELEKVASYDGNITIVGRVSNPGGTQAPYRAVPYAKLFVSGSVGDGSQGNATLNDHSIVQLDASGMDIALRGASRTTGSMTVTFKKSAAR